MNYNRKCTRNNPFILQLESIVLKEGYKSVKDFVQSKIKEGLNFHEIQQFIGEKYDLKVHYLTIFNNLRYLAPPNYFKGTMDFPKWKVIAKKRGYEDVKTMLQDFVKQSFPIAKIAKTLKTTRYVIDKLAKAYKVDLKEVLSDDAKLMGFTQTWKYLFWLKKAQKLGYDRVYDLFRDLFDEGLSYQEASWKLGVTRMALFKRCQKINMILKEREEEKNGIRSTG